MFRIARRDGATSRHPSVFVSYGYENFVEHRDDQEPQGPDSHRYGDFGSCGGVIGELFQGGGDEAPRIVIFPKAL